MSAALPFALPLRPVRPAWLRPAALAAAIALHVALFLPLTWPEAPPSLALPPVEVEIVPQAETAQEAAAGGGEPVPEAQASVPDVSEARPSEPADAAEPAPGVEETW